jgi:hypothetical protein
MTDGEVLDELLSKQACMELVHKLARGLDRMDETLLRSLFHDDATDAHGGYIGSASGFVDWAFGLLRNMERTQHFIGNVLIAINGNRAAGESYFVANHDLRSPAGDPLRMIAAGRYLDPFERRDGVWKIAHRQAVYDWNANLERTDTWDRSPETVRTFGQRGEADAIYAHLSMVNA